METVERVVTSGSRHRKPSATPRHAAVATAALVILMAALGLVASHGKAGAAASTSPKGTIYNGTTNIATVAENDGSAVELGIKFSVTQPGSIKQVLFYKSRQNTGVHTGSLWSSTGTRLATATFSSETSSGWQSVTLPSPVSVVPGQTYTASYHTNTGYYSERQWSFNSSSAAIRGVQPRGGVYNYGSGAYPTSTWNQSAYYVDVLFVPSSGSIAPVSSTAAAPLATSGATTAAPTSAASTTAAATSAAATSAAPASSSPAPVTSSTSASSLQSTALAATYPDATNTGVPAGTVLKASGPVTVNTAGTVISGLDVTGCIIVNAPNVTIQNTRVHAQGSCNSEGIQVRSTGASITDVEVDGQHDAGVSECLGWGGYTATRVNLHGCGDGARANDNTIVRDSYIHDLYYVNGSHNDGVQTTEGFNIQILHNRIENPNDQTSAVMLGADQGSIGNIVVSDNLLDGGGFSLYGGAHPPAGNTISKISITSNAISTRFFAQGGYYGPVTALDDPNISTSGNHWYETGQPIS